MPQPDDGVTRRPPHGATVLGSDGIAATVTESAIDGCVGLALADGSLALVEADVLVPSADGVWHIDAALGDPDAAGAGLLTIPVIRESLEVGSRRIAAGRVRVSRRAEQQEQTVDLAGWIEEATIEHIPVGRVLEPGAVPAVREEDGALIVPVLEETLVLEKRLVLREELRIVRIRRETSRRETVTLRRDRVEVERLPPADGAASTPALDSATAHDKPTGDA
jgi:uncharacterized protein (TIGR02271 family)